MRDQVRKKEKEIRLKEVERGCFFSQGLSTLSSSLLRSFYGKILRLSFSGTPSCPSWPSLSQTENGPNGHSYPYSRTLTHKQDVTPKCHDHTIDDMFNHAILRNSLKCHSSSISYSSPERFFTSFLYTSRCIRVKFTSHQNRTKTTLTRFYKNFPILAKGGNVKLSRSKIDRSKKFHHSKLSIANIFSFRFFFYVHR